MEGGEEVDLQVCYLVSLPGLLPISSGSEERPPLNAAFDYQMMYI